MVKTLLTTAAAVAGLSILSAGAALAQDDAKVKRGAEVFTEKKCQTCHSVEGKGNAKGPLDGVGTELTAQQIREWLTSPAEMHAKQKEPRRTMKPMHPKLPPEDLDALVAYIQTLKKK